jgi:flagellar basal body-associated protein FliL
VQIKENKLKFLWNKFKLILEFLDSPEEPTPRSEMINNIMLGVLLVLILVAVFIGKMLLVTGPKAFPVTGEISSQVK